MSVIKEFLVSLGFKVDKNSQAKFTKGLKDASRAAAKLGAVVTVAAGLIGKFVSDTANGFDEIGHLSERVNSTAEEVKKLGFVASLTGSSVSAVASSLDRFNRTAGEAALGIGRGATAFKELNLRAKNSNGTLKSTAELMQEVGEKIRDMTAQKQVAVLERLGIDPTLVNALSGDVSNLRQEFDKIYKGAGINANKAAKSSEAFIDSLTRMKFALGALRDAVVLKVMPQIQGGIDQFRKFMIDNGPNIIRSITPIVNVILNMTKTFFLASTKIFNLFQKLNDVTGGWAGIILGIAAAIRVLNLSLLATPVGAILAAVAALGLLIDDFLVFKEGGLALINWQPLIDDLTLIEDKLRAIGGFFERLGSKMRVANPFPKVNEGFQSSAPKSVFERFGLSNVSTPANQTVNQTTKIIVEGGGSAESIGRSVAGEQGRVNADMARNMSGAFR